MAEVDLANFFTAHACIQFRGDVEGAVGLASPDADVADVEISMLERRSG